MEKRFKKILVGMLVMSMLAGGVFSAQADTNDTAAETVKSKAVVAQCIMTSPPMSEIQYQKFIAYLTQEYAPELQAGWEKAFADRAGIKLPVPSDLPSDVKITGINKMGNIKFGTVTVTVKDKDSEITDPNAEIESPEIFMSSVQNPGGKLDPETDVINATEEADCITVTFPEDANKILEESGSVISVSLPHGDDKTFTEQLTMQDELDKAITSNDGQAINTVLGKMLINYNAVSEDIKSSLSKVEITTTEK